VVAGKLRLETTMVSLGDVLQVTIDAARQQPRPKKCGYCWN
jgi:hypothetical protein